MFLKRGSVEGRAWPRLNCPVIVASGADTNGCREKPAKNRESVPAASLRTGTGLGGIRGPQANDILGMNAGRLFDRAVRRRKRGVPPESNARRFLALIHDDEDRKVTDELKSLTGYARCKSVWRVQSPTSRKPRGPSCVDPAPSARLLRVGPFGYTGQINSRLEILERSPSRLRET